MARHFPLQPLLDHSRHRMDAAERALRVLKQQEEAARRRLDELEGFRQEYRDRLMQSATGGMHIHLMRDFHAFLAKIDAAIRQQTQLVHETHARWETAHKRWLDERQKVKAYEVLAQRHQQQEVQRAQRRDQRLTDEHAAKAVLYRSGAD
ncbi:MAG: flagellar export protein FliJ [Thiobacillaceae bacterium]